MLAQITTIEQFETAMHLMRAGTGLLYAGMFFTVLMFFVSAYAVWRKDERLVHAARRGQYALLLITAICCALIYVGIFEGYYFVGYIRDVTENSEIVPFKIAGLWARQQGSLLFWCLILCVHGAIYAFTQRHNRTDRRLPYALIALCAVQFFFFFIMCNPESFDRSNPFAVDYGWMLKPDWAKISAGPILEAGRSATDPGIQELLVALVNGGKGSMTFAELHHAINELVRQFSEVVTQFLIGANTDWKLLEDARALCLKHLQTSRFAASAPKLQQFLRSDAVEIIAAIKVGGLSSELTDRLKDALAGLKDEADAIAQDREPVAAGGNFWENSI